MNWQPVGCSASVFASLEPGLQRGVMPLSSPRESRGVLSPHLLLISCFPLATLLCLESHFPPLWGVSSDPQQPLGKPYSTPTERCFSQAQGRRSVEHGWGTNQNRSRQSMEMWGRAQCLSQPGGSCCTMCWAVHLSPLSGLDDLIIYRVLVASDFYSVILGGTLQIIEHSSWQSTALGPNSACSLFL